MPRFARGSRPWLLTPLAVAMVLLAVALVPGLQWLAWLAILPALVLAFFLVFFRDPDREPAEGIASPADGKVVRMDRVDDPDLGPADRVAVFMSPKDVHVNRVPLGAKVVSVEHRAGGHMPAFRKDSHLNERVETILDTRLGRVKVVQIAGAVARRIVPYLEPGQTVAKGDRLGLIRLGSRCDLLVPPDAVAWSVALGEQVYGNTTSLGRPQAPVKARAKPAKPAKRSPPKTKSAPKSTAKKAAKKGGRSK